MERALALASVLVSVSGCSCRWCALVAVAGLRNQRVSALPSQDPKARVQPYGVSASRLSIHSSPGSFEMQAYDYFLGSGRLGVDCGADLDGT